MLGVLATAAPTSDPGAARVDATRKLRRALNPRVTNTTETHVFEIPASSLSHTNQPHNRQGGPR